MLNLAQKVYLASLARKEAAMPWEDDSAVPEALAGLGGAGATAGAIYGPRAYAKLSNKLYDAINARKFGHSKPRARRATRSLRNQAKGMSMADINAIPAEEMMMPKSVAKALIAESRAHRAARKYDVALHKLFGKAGIKGKYSKAVAAAALASLVGGGASGIAHLLDD